MSYINALQIRDEVLVWERNDEGREAKIFPAPYYFYVKDDNGEFTSIYGDKLTRHDFGSGQEFREAKKQLEANNVEVFESDITPDLKVLAEEYYNAKVPKLHVTNYDIEVDYDPDIGFSSPSNPYAPINSVALHHAWKDEYIVLAVPPNMAPFKSNKDKWVWGDAPEEFYQQMNEIS